MSGGDQQARLKTGLRVQTQEVRHAQFSVHGAKGRDGTGHGVNATFVLALLAGKQTLRELAPDAPERQAVLDAQGQLLARQIQRLRGIAMQARDPAHKAQGVGL